MNNKEIEFVSANLTAGAAKAKTQVMMAMLEPEFRRLYATFLGNENYVKIYRNFPRAIGDCLLGCLPDFVKQRSGQIIAAYADAREGFRPEVIDASFKTVEVGGKRLRVLQDGFAFLYFDSKPPIIVSTDKEINGSARVGVYCHTAPEMFLNEWLVYSAEHNYLRGHSLFADGEILQRERSYAWDDILLPEKTRSAIITHVQKFLENRTKLANLGVKTRRGLIFQGPPGTGKTLACKCLESILTDNGITCLWVLPRHVLHPDSVEAIFSLARFIAPTAIIIEDIDLFVQDREEGGSGNAVLGQLMTELDGVKDDAHLLVIATTNRPEVVENALRNRPGRFDRHVTFEAMRDQGLRKTMLQVRLKNALISDENIAYLAEATHEHTPAQLEEVAATIMIIGVQNGADTPLEKNDHFKDNGKVLVSRALIDSALEDVAFEFKGRLGFIT